MMMMMMMMMMMWLWTGQRAYAWMLIDRKLTTRKQCSVWVATPAHAEQQ
jgi:hypothetical protein